MSGKVALRKLTEAERGRRAAALLAANANAYVSEDDIKLMAVEFCKATQAQPMDTAPRDGTHILAFLYQAPDDYEYRGFGEWREIWFGKAVRFMDAHMPWHAGDPHDSHSGGEAPEHFGEGVPIAWLPLPARPQAARR